MKLPTLPNPKGTQQRIQVIFGGINRLPGAGNGAIFDMCNLYPDASGALCTRQHRVFLSDVEDQNVTGLFAHDGTLYYSAWDDNPTPYTSHLYKREGTQWTPVATLEGGTPERAAAQRIAASLGKRLIIFPEKWIYDSGAGTRDALQKADYNHVTFPENGELYGEPATNNTIHIDLNVDPSIWNWDNVRVGDYVYVQYYDPNTHEYITGPNSGKGGIIREKSSDGKDLRFDEGTFVTDTTGSFVFVRRDVPDLDVLFSHDNRLWGAKGDTIYASKLGDPYNWYVFDGLSTDSWSWDTLTGGDFTGGCSYMGLPVFFKPDRIFKIYGLDARRFQGQPTPDVGVAPGCGASLAVAGNQLMYLSPSGIAAYAGTHATIISNPLGDGPWQSATAGTDGTRYYIQVADLAGKQRLYVFDTELMTWHSEAQYAGDGGDPDVEVTGHTFWFCQLRGQLIFAHNYPDGTMSIHAERRSVPQGSGDVLDGTDETYLGVYWFVEFGDITSAMQQGRGDSANKKHIVKVLLRVSAERATWIDVQIRYDSKGEWQDLKSFVQYTGKASYYLPIVPKRCDHFRLRIKGRGLETVLHSLTLELSGGSPNKL
jgi:hypothetical protein